MAPHVTPLAHKYCFNLSYQKWGLTEHSDVNVKGTNEKILKASSVTRQGRTILFDLIVY